MSGLVLKLAPSERLLINGAVIENGQRRGRLNILTPGAHILRLRDAIHPNEATTPVRRLCYLAQLVLSGDRRIEDVAPDLVSGINAISQIFTEPQQHEALSLARRAASDGQAYQTLKALRSLLHVETELLSRSPV
ncbi:flagellar biosynthesis repressor FlbT [Rhodobacteraceae bacterium THAF1]|uniref:flagellar biosynthesis repressor FlbT n=1 Tax=Palleronia sp. THAF1 TaxID=2587842 RepID=UPI000F3AEE71|nr:flagellar biosynthesis repressor FlbT [Palleronia sp. THAF1]QFU10294.1 flagellar biosynthesis repressor FlbT [Palleronia sp. THAF1]VDC16801.1 flagellar biosynthesis repressor FlbT [Rhodobacteraceae bacterium THAF1]